MENNQTSSKKRLISIEEEKLKSKVNHCCTEGSPTRLPQRQLLLDLEIHQKHPSQPQTSQRVLVSIKPRAPAIKTLYIAEKSRFHSRKNSEKSGKSGSRSRLGIGDHSSFTSHYSGNDSTLITPSDVYETETDSKSLSAIEKCSKNNKSESSTESRCSQIDHLAQKVNIYNLKQRLAEKCYVYTQPQLIMNHPKIETSSDKSKVNKVDIGTYIISPSSDDSVLVSTNVISKLNQRIDYLERKILKQEMVFRSIDPNIHLSSSDDECKEHPRMKAASGSGRPCCSYIQQYSHIPETSAFQRYAQQTSPLSPSKATTLDKEHNSEQYGRDFTAYDGITARGRRQSASVPCKRDDFPKMAAERMHKIRHKLNPVRDYRLMDTVHYLAQGEFAPRDDGIKLTPSREAVLSDIIWEDVCRTHWPNTRLGRRAAAQPERFSTRCELQRLIDSLLRERVAHVERRRRRHYRIVKLNHRHESCRPVGKTGDIIVASHKKKESNEDPISDHNAASAMMSDWRREEPSARRGPRSHDRLTYHEMHQKRKFKPDDCAPGPSYAVTKSPTSTEPTCCYQSLSPIRPKRSISALQKSFNRDRPQESISVSSSSCKRQMRNPRLVIKKDTPHRKYKKEEPDLEQYILLPTLVIRTPSNVRRQKKFNELYHRILNVQLHNEQECAVESETAPQTSTPNPNMKDIGLNINVTLSRSEEHLLKQPNSE